MATSPNLSAIMCDGMGWFSDLDYKRMLLIYDEIYYLLPQNLVPFKDVNGKKQSLYFPVINNEAPSFKVYHYNPTKDYSQLILAAAQADINNNGFNVAVDSIPLHEQLYTWRVVNADGDIGSGQSINLGAHQTQFAHAVLLNKFLLAAHSLNCIPVTGKPYIHGLISEKYNASIKRLRDELPDLLPEPLRTQDVKHNPVISRIVSSLVPDEELERRTEFDILKFKEKNKSLFQRYSYTMRKLIDRVGSLPVTVGFEHEVDELIKTDVWKEKIETEKELRSAWVGLFNSMVIKTVAGLAGIGVVPFFSLGAITLASVATASLAISPWVLSELINFAKAKKKAQENGLYYLMKFAS